MEIYSLIYLSQANVPFEVGELKELEELAQRENKVHGITGLLNYAGGKFFQYIEGQQQQLHQLMDNISNDGRHEVLKLINMPATNQRLFPEWNMKVFNHKGDYYPTVEANVQRLIENFANAGFKEENLITLLRRELAQIEG